MINFKMPKFISFTLKKDISKLLITFIPHSYNHRNPYHGRTFSIDYEKNKIYRITTWLDACLSQKKFTISFSNTPNLMEKGQGLTPIAIRLGNLSEHGYLNREYYFNCQNINELEMMYNMIIKSFNVLTKHDSFKLQ